MSGAAAEPDFQGGAATRLDPAYEQAKKLCFNYYYGPNWSQLIWGRLLFEEEPLVFRPDPWPNGVAANRKNPDQIIHYSYFQGLTPRRSHQQPWKRRLPLCYARRCAE